MAQCESGGDPRQRATYDGVTYYGKWQMNADFWKTYGGLAYARTADQATEAQQDEVAYRGYQARGWQPWACKRVLR